MDVETDEFAIGKDGERVVILVHDLEIGLDVGNAYRMARHLLAAVRDITGADFSLVGKMEPELMRRLGMEPPRGAKPPTGPSDDPGTPPSPG